MGLPLCALGGVLYSWASGKTVLDGVINAYGALYKIPGTSTLDRLQHVYLTCCFSAPEEAPSQKASMRACHLQDSRNISSPRALQRCCYQTGWSGAAL